MTNDCNAETGNVYDRCMMPFGHSAQERDDAREAARMADRRCAAAVIQMKNMREAIDGLRLQHRDCEDTWYACPKTGNCSDPNWDNREPVCDCGADEHNAKIDAIVGAKPLSAKRMAILAEIQRAEEQQ